MLKLGISTMNPFTIFRKFQLKMLVKGGLKLGQNVYVEERVSFDSSFCWLISIGDGSTLSKNVVILAHDASTKRSLNYTKIGRVQIGRETFIGACSVILPGVTIGSNVIIGAGSVVTHDIPDNCVAVGNPARVIESTIDYVEKQKDCLSKRPKFMAKGWTVGNSLTSQNKASMNKALSDGIGFVE
jgi:maltose O-acetyltransferase